MQLFTAYNSLLQYRIPSHNFFVLLVYTGFVYLYVYAIVPAGDFID